MQLLLPPGCPLCIICNVCNVQHTASVLNVTQENTNSGVMIGEKFASGLLTLISLVAGRYDSHNFLQALLKMA
jgi:hypothetical protein